VTQAPNKDNKNKKVTLTPRKGGSVTNNNNNNNGESNAAKKASDTSKE
jgi:hypothetical protein